MIPSKKLVLNITRAVAGGLLASAMIFGGLGCAGGDGSAGNAVDAARGTGDDNPVVDDSADDAAAGGDTTPTE